LKPLVEGTDLRSTKEAEAEAILVEERRVLEQKELAAKLKKAKDKREYSKKSGKKSIAALEEEMVTPAELTSHAMYTEKKTESLIHFIFSLSRIWMLGAGSKI